MRQEHRQEWLCRAMAFERSKVAASAKLKLTVSFALRSLSPVPRVI
jgi:hypothetical protein